MKILLSPSESKILPSVNCATNPSTTPTSLKNPANIVKNNLSTDKMWGGFDSRINHICAYLKELESADDENLKKIFGSKHIPIDSLSHSLKILESSTTKAITLYNGVAFKALDFMSLDSGAQDFVLENVLIFSNLFGMVRAKDNLPFYHLNQNYKSPTLNLKNLYHAQSQEIDAFLANEDIIIDLRAEIYIKAYPLKQSHFVLKMPDKKISHQAKLYRGSALRELALFQSKLLYPSAQNTSNAKISNKNSSNASSNQLKQYLHTFFELRF
ncbi:peroxide stress protein YaaA [Helicobacter fennelliae]|uniref:peroxide stress protein YaaA n=1 Tax=Helicobacter fennelliae TaxID=215 RepID=UPI000DFC0C0E|nr:peroxide stress protein YaaA [Helicobacter fennelliae]STQ84615.1 Protein of uncharacterised function (DUF328) [Helicobacter fennelliae]